MTPLNTRLELRFQGCSLGLSARRIWEHIQFRQINPFELIPQRRPINPQKYVDITDISDPVMIITSCTLYDLYSGNNPGLPKSQVELLLRQIETVSAQEWLYSVTHHLLNFREELAVRNIPELFLPADNASPLGVRGLHCALAAWLSARRTEKADAKQWQQRLNNLSLKGLRADEMEFTFMDEALKRKMGMTLTGEEVMSCLNYQPLKLSILPVTYKINSHLNFVKVPANATFKRIKPKLKRGAVTHPQWRDPVLGYWVDVLEWNDLLGSQKGWMAFTHRGEAIVSYDKPFGLCATHEDAWAMANEHAHRAFPKLTIKGLWKRYRLSGGEKYREWLFTLPYYGASYFSDHFELRNVLLHVRSDFREGTDGERILVLQEVQSDWSQEARRISKSDNYSTDEIPAPPWLNEWPSLALKLMLLYAANCGANALVWTPGHVQVKRYEGLGKDGLYKLYDQTLPSEINRILKPYRTKCESIDVFLPVNFYIEPTDFGYEILDEEKRCMGESTSWEGARRLLPDGAHEVLTPMHGIRLDESLRQAILKKGFYAWGSGIK